MKFTATVFKLPSFVGTVRGSTCCLKKWTYTFHQKAPHWPIAMQTRNVSHVTGKAGENVGHVYPDSAAEQRLQKATALLPNGPSFRDFLNKGDNRQINITNENHYIPQSEYSGENRKGRSSICNSMY